MKILLMSVLISMKVLAVTVNVINVKEVQITIDNNKQQLIKDLSIDVEENETICLINESNAIVIVSYDSGEKKQLLFSKQKCETIAVKVKKVKPKISERIVTALLNTFTIVVETSRDGVGKDTNKATYTKDILLSEMKNVKFLEFDTSSWTLPLVLKIYEEDKVVEQFELKDKDNEAKFNIPSTMLLGGRRVEIKGEFSGLVLNSKIKAGK